jgi:hypothetical protein
LPAPSALPAYPSLDAVRPSTRSLRSLAQDEGIFFPAKNSTRRILSKRSASKDEVISFLQ